MLAVWALLAHGADGARPAAAPRSLAAAHVLLLNSYSPGRAAFDRVVESFVLRLRTAGVPLEHIHVEYLHLNQPNAELVAPARRAMLSAQYGGLPIDMLVALQQPALNFTLKELAEISPQAPLLTDSEPSTLQLDANRRPLFKYTIMPDIGATMKEVMLLLPRTRRVVVPAGVAEADRAFLRQAEVELAPWMRRIQVEFLQNMSWAEQMRYVANLTSDTVVITGMFNRDRDGYTLPTIDAARETMRAANVPVFALFDTIVGEGAVGGAVRNLPQSGIELADSVLAVLEGRQAVNAGVTRVPAGPVQSLYDWRQLERWQIDAAPLEQATFLNRPPSLWRAHRAVVQGGGAVIVLLAGLLAALLVQRRRLARTELASRESEERFRALVEYAPEAILVLDLEDCRYVDANGEAEKLFGHPRAQLQGMHPSTLYAPGQFGDGDVQQQVRGISERAWAGEPLAFERVVRRPDGSTVTVEVKLRRLPAHGKRWLRCSYEDITARKKNEAELLAHRDRLEELVRQRTEALSDAVAEARAANQARSVFLAKMSEELRAPLDAVISLSGALAASPSMFEPEQRQLGTINRAGQQLLGMIDDLLELSRIETGRVPLVLAPLALQPLLKEVMDIVRLRTENDRVMLVLACGGLPPPILADGPRLRQVLANLLSHAAGALGQGTVTLAADAQTAGARRWRLAFAVRDSSAGRAGLARQDDGYAGAGLDLGISREFVRLLGSELLVRRQAGEGAEYSFSIEVDEAPLA